MIQYQCPRFHLYHAPEGDESGCPICAAQQSELTKTRGVWSETGSVDATDLALNPGAARPAAPATGKATVGVYAHLGVASEPVVGWVVCIEGPDKGRDWRLVSGRNSIGRGEGMAVQLTNDRGVSRERHAVISFDPRRGGFSLSPGEGSGLVYCNGYEVAVPVMLAAHDRIELGASTLLFVPLVGDTFSWTG